MLWKASTIGAVALLVFVVVRSAPASEALSGPAIIRITDREIAFSRVDVGRRGRSPGDLEITRRLLFNRRIRPQSIGRSETVCTVVAGSARQCTATYVLPAGRIMVSGEMRHRQFFLFAVTGGTGLYNNVRGTLTVTLQGRRPRRSIVFFRLVV
jgi:hypothetical protein